MKIAVVDFREIKTSKIWRLEAEFYNQVAQIGPNFVTGEDAIGFVQYGTSKELNENGDGYPILRLNEFDSLFIKNPEKFCDKIDFETYRNLSLKKDDVLICRTNGNPKLVGKSALVPKDYDFAFASYLFRVRPKNKIINSATLAIYLNSKIGRTEIEKNLMISNQANFSPPKFRDIQIPILGYDIQSLIEEIVYRAFERLQLANSIYLAIERLLLQELGLINWKQTHRLAFIKNFSDTQSAERIDAEYYQPKYEEIIKAIKLLKDHERLGDIVSIKKCVEPGSDAYRDAGIPFLRVSNLSKFGPDNDNQQYLSESLYEILKTHQPKKGEILLSKDASPGIAYYLKEAPGKMIPSSGILRLTVKYPEVIYPEYLTLVLNSLVVQKQMERDTGGSVINHWLVNQIKDTLIPILPIAIQKGISVKLNESFLSRDQANRLLDVAKRGIEIAIEKNEKDAHSWIEAEMRG